MKVSTHNITSGYIYKQDGRGYGRLFKTIMSKWIQIKQYTIIHIYVETTNTTQSKWRICIVWCRVSFHKYTRGWHNFLHHWWNLPEEYLTTNSKIILKRLLHKLTIEVSFQFNYNLLNQTNECKMGGPLSVTLADIHIIRMKADVVVPTRPIFKNDMLMIHIIAAWKIPLINIGLLLIALYLSFYSSSKWGHWIHHITLAFWSLSNIKPWRS